MTDAIEKRPFARSSAAPMLQERPGLAGRVFHDDLLGEDAMRRNLLLAIGVVGLGYYIWSFFVASRYESLCQLSYWSATSAQLRACEEQQSELQRR
jgi:hypothetical protein